MKAIQRLILGLVCALVASVGLTVATAPAQASDSYGTDWHANHGASFWGAYDQYTASRSASLTMATKILNHPNAPGVGAQAMCAVLVYPVAMAACITVMGLHWENAKSAAHAVQNGSKQDCIGIRVYNQPAVWPFATPISRVNCFFGINVPPGGGGGGGGGAGGGGSWKSAKIVTAPLHVASLVSRLAGNGAGGGGSW